MTITREDYLNLRGIDLLIDFQGSTFDVNVDKAVDLWLTRIEEEFKEYLNSHYETPKFYQEDKFKSALLHQIDYARDNGIGNVFILAPKAYTVLFNAGMANIIRNSRIDSWWGLWE